MRVDVLSIFPETVSCALAEGIPRIAQEAGELELACHDLRAWTDDAHRTVDDRPFGGGPGMVMKADPFFRGVEAVREQGEAPGLVVLLTPQGERLTQERVDRLAEEPRLIVLCGRYEGVDERVRTLADVELSVGDYVLSGGEPAAIALIDAVARLLPGVLGNIGSAADESFRDGLLEYPQYTRPASYRGMEVPEVLLSGDHARIEAFRREESSRRTARRRPDLLAGMLHNAGQEAGEDGPPSFPTDKKGKK
jgi:tRNA (guanine37-N1)-methyltransferase